MLSFETKIVNFKKQKFSIMLADSFPKQLLGLMHRPEISANQGMLFTFGTHGKPSIWMHNMHFAIDCIWIDQNGKVVHLVKNMKPCTSMLNCPTYVPPLPAKHVLEIKAGISDKLKISKGTDLSSFIK